MGAAAPDRPRVLVTLGTVVPTMAGTDVVSVLLEALADLPVEVVLALGDATPPAGRRCPRTSAPRLPAPLGGAADLPADRPPRRFGTTAAPLHFGVPQLVLPSFADNPLSAQRVGDRGVGLSHDPTTLAVATARTLVGRLLEEPAFPRRRPRSRPRWPPSRARRRSSAGSRPSWPTNPLLERSSTVNG